MTNWYLQNGRDSDVVISSRIRIARNLREYPFTSKYTKEDAKKITEQMKSVVPTLGYGLKFIMLKDIDDLSKMALVEKHIISPEFAFSKNEYAGIIINDDESICFMINEEDHIRMQIFATGMELENLLGLAIEIDEKLEGLVNYTYHEKYGFLTQCPTNVGTGLRGSVMVHLPALKLTGNINKVLDVVNHFGMNIRGMYGEGSQSKGDIYQISNNQSLGMSEKEIIKKLANITEKVIEQERLARKILGRNTLELEDMVYRAYGILTNAKKITSEECNKLLSKVKLGTDLGIIKELNDSKISKLELYTMPANLQKYAKRNLDVYERDIKRAEIIKQIIEQ